MTKKKEQKKNHCWAGISLVIITILIVGGIIYYKIPKEVCHKEYETVKLTIEPFCSQWGNVKGFVVKPDNTVEVLCDGEVSNIYGWIESYGCENITCLAKVEKEVCEVVYP